MYSGLSHRFGRGYVADLAEDKFARWILTLIVRVVICAAGCISSATGWIRQSKTRLQADTRNPGARGDCASEQRKDETASK